MVDQKKVVEGLRTEREHLASYLSELPEAAWEKPSLCEGWRVRDVVAHLVGNAKDVADYRLEDAGSVEYNQRQIDERAGSSPADLLSEWEKEGARLEEGAAALPAEVWDGDFPPFGTAGDGVTRLLEDIWVHHQDIRIALGDDPVDGPGVWGSIHSITVELKQRCPRLSPGVGTVRIRVGDFDETVEVGEGSTVTIRGDAIAFVLVATGRVALDDAISDGRLKIEPDVPAGFPDALNIYGP